MSQEPTIPDEVKTHAAWFRLEEQGAWYSKASAFNKRCYFWIKLIQILLSGAIPIIALIDFSQAKYCVAIFGALIAAFEAIQQLFQFHTLWFEYRATSEQLKHERYLFLSLSGPYRGLGQGEGLLLLAERIEEHISKEHAKWISISHQAAVDISGKIKELQAQAPKTG